MTSQEVTPWRELMLTVVSEIMENTAFTEVRAAEAAPVYDEQVRGVSLLIHEPLQGEFLLFMGQQLLTNLTSLVYGLEPEVPDSPEDPDTPAAPEAIDPKIENDLLAELLNTIAGRFLATVLPPEQGFLLGLPSRESGPLNCPAAPCLRWDFTVEGHPLTLMLHGESILTLA